MKALTCEMCGSTNLIKKDGVFVCQSCGTQYSVEEAKKMMVEGTVDIKGTVKVDTTEELKNLYELARRARDIDNKENAAKYYDMILIKDPQSWEANFYVAFFKATSCKIEEIVSAANSLSSSIKPVLELVRDNVESEEEQKRVLAELKQRLFSAAKLFEQASQNHLDGYGFNKTQQKNQEEYIERVTAAAHILYQFGDALESVFLGRYGAVSTYSWMNAIEINKSNLSNIRLNFSDGLLNYNAAYNAANKVLDNNLRGYVDKIKKYDSEYEPPKLNRIIIPAWVYVVFIIVIIIIFSLQ